MAKKPRTEAEIKKHPLEALVVISDTHIGSQLGLCPPEAFCMDDGGFYEPSIYQRALWQWWEEFWQWADAVTRGKPYGVVLNGDSVEGNKHGWGQVSMNPVNQIGMAYEVLKPVIERCDGRMFITRGTTAHGGEEGNCEELLARQLGAIPSDGGQWARWELWYRMPGGLCNFMHHIGTTSSSAHETSAINAELSAAYTDCGRWNKEVPMVICRSHRHRCAEIRLPTAHGYATSFVTASWQLKTSFACRVAGGRVTMPQIGGSVIIQGDEELYTRHFVREVKRPREETIYVTQ